MIPENYSHPENVIQNNYYNLKELQHLKISKNKKYLPLFYISSCSLNANLKNFKGAFSDLNQFLAAESPWKMMENAFHCTLKALFVLKIFKILSWLFGHVAKWLGKKNKVDFKFYDITAWSPNNHNT